MFTIPFTLHSAAPLTPVSFVGERSWSQTTGSSIVLTLPVGTAEGDLMIAVGGSDSSLGATSVDGLSTAGWTGFGQLTSGNMSFQVFWKKAGAAESTPTMNFSGGSFIITRFAALYVFRDTGTPTLEDFSAVSADPLAVPGYEDSNPTGVDFIATFCDESTNGTQTPAGFTNSSFPFGSGGFPLVSYKQGNSLGTINWSLDYNVAPTNMAWNRIHIPPDIPAPPASGNPLTFVSSNSSSAGAGGGFNLSLPVTPLAGDVLVVVSGSVDQGGSQPPVPTISGGPPGGFTNAVNNVVTNNARTTLSIDYATAVGTESSLNISWGGINNLDYRGAAVLIYRPVGTVTYDANPSATTTTSGSGQTTSTFTDGAGQTILAWIGNATSTNTLNVSLAPSDATQRQITDGSGFAQQDKELAVYELVHADRGAISRGLAWNGSITEGVCGGLGLTDD